jgi:hypothetical protein
VRQSWQSARSNAEALTKARGIVPADSDTVWLPASWTSVFRGLGSG